MRGITRHEGDRHHGFQNFDAPIQGIRPGSELRGTEATGKSRYRRIDGLATNWLDITEVPSALWFDVLFLLREKHLRQALVEPRAG